jgi:dTDP-4-dehydrorhamnose 3,5-epimerase
MKFIAQNIPDVVLIEPKIFEDSRGFFLETYREELFAEAGITARFIQDNHSRSQQGVLRGLHYQIRYPQGKLMRVIFGEIFDVAVDIRKSSASFGQWVGVHLSAQNKNQLWIPPGFAHGFYVISDSAEVTYKVNDQYAPEWERSILWNDPEIGIEWPILNGTTPSMSQKDMDASTLKNADVFQ